MGFLLPWRLQGDSGQTGLDSEIVDGVLDSLWKSDRIEGISTLGGRHPSLDDIRRMLPDRTRRMA